MTSSDTDEPGPVSGTPRNIGTAHTVVRASIDTPVDRVLLDYDARFLRRKRLVTEGGASVLVDLPETVSLEQGDALVLADGGRVAVIAAPEPLLEVRGADLARLAWHIGNRHTPCQIGPDRLLIRADPVLKTMLAGLGADVRAMTGPFRPEGGAYGHGRTMGHDHAHFHGPDHAHTHDRAHTHDHGDGHDHGHTHDHVDGPAHSHEHPHRHAQDPAPDHSAAQAEAPAGPVGTASRA